MAGWQWKCKCSNYQKVVDPAESISSLKLLLYHDVYFLVLPAISTPPPPSDHHPFLELDNVDLLTA